MAILHAFTGPFQAPLTGLAVGDAQGMPFEVKKCGCPELMKWDGETYQRGVYHKLDPGRWTDDTSMAQALAESLVEEEGFNPADIAKRYVRWFEGPAFDGAGKTTKKALSNLATGCPWVASGIPRAQGNGPAMRIAPLGFFYHRLPNRIIAKMAEVEATITHDDEVARQGSVAIALAVAMLARKEATPTTLMQKVIDQLGETQIRQRCIHALAKTRVAPHGVQERAQALADIGSKFHILETVPAALYAFATSTNYRSAIEVAIRAGGDTDTTAAIAGALAGTYYGIEQVAPYLPRLYEQATLRALETQLFTQGPKVEGPVDWR